MERSLHEYYSIETLKVEFVFKKSSELTKLNFFCPYLEQRNRPGFVDISPTLVIDTSMERSSLILQHGSTEIRTFFNKVEIKF